MQKDLLRVGVVGGGNVGGMAAMWLAVSGIADEVILVDLDEGKAKGKAMDIDDALGLLKRDGKVIGTSDVRDLSNVDAVIITAGVPRKPGMSREDLIQKNAKIVGDIADELVKVTREDMLWMIVTNPLDVITTFVYRRIRMKRNKVVGMGISLDTGRMRNYVSEKLGISRRCVDCMVIGPHGKGMIPLVDGVSIDGIRVLLSDEDKEDIEENTINRGAQIVSAFGNGSAYVAPGISAALMIETIFSNVENLSLGAVPLEGEFGITDVCLGVPIIVGRGQWLRVYDVELDKEVLLALREAGENVKKILSSIEV